MDLSKYDWTPIRNEESVEDSDEIKILMHGRSFVFTGQVVPLALGWGLLFSALKTVVDRESVGFLLAVSRLELANAGWALLNDADTESDGNL